MLFISTLCNLLAVTAEQNAPSLRSPRIPSTSLAPATRSLEQKGDKHFSCFVCNNVTPQRKQEFGRVLLASSPSSWYTYVEEDDDEQDKSIKEQRESIIAMGGDPFFLGDDTDEEEEMPFLESSDDQDEEIVAMGGDASFLSNLLEKRDSDLPFGGNEMPSSRRASMMDAAFGKPSAVPQLEDGAMEDDALTLAAMGGDPFFLIQDDAAAMELSDLGGDPSFLRGVDDQDMDAATLEAMGGDPFFLPDDDE